MAARSRWFDPKLCELSNVGNATRNGSQAGKAGTDKQPERLLEHDANDELRVVRAGSGCPAHMIDVMSQSFPSAFRPLLGETERNPVFRLSPTRDAYRGHEENSDGLSFGRH